MFRPVQVWSLDEGGPDALGLSCSYEGLFLGATALIEKEDGRYVVRPPHELDGLLENGYAAKIAGRRLIPGLCAVATALTEGNLCRARIAAVHLRLPPLRDGLARLALETKDLLLKFERRQALGHGDVTAHSDGLLGKDYDPAEPRDWHGRWTTDGAGTPSPSRLKPVQVANEGEEKDAPFLTNFPAIALARARAAAVDPAEAAPILQDILKQNPAEYANSRAMYLQSAIPTPTQNFVTMAVGVAEDAQGKRYVLISSSEMEDSTGLSYIRPQVDSLTQPNEITVPFIGHAEINILQYAKANNLRLIAVGAGRPYCTTCAEALDAAGVLATGPRK